MFANRDIYRPFRLFLLLLVVGTLRVAAQEVIHFKGLLTVDEFRGEAEYDYMLVREDSVLNGPFRMQSSDLGALMEKTDRSFLFSGSFSNGLANGPWTFEFGEFKTDSTTRVVDFQYRLNVSGVQHTALGEIVQGRPNGSWVHRVLQVENSKVRDTVFHSGFTFEKGVPQQSFEITAGEGTLVGRFLRDGLAHDVWVVYLNEDPEETEKWHFADGRLAQITYGSADGEQLVDIFKKPFDSSRSVDYDSRYSALVEMLQKRSHPDFEATMPRLLKENRGYYKKLDTLLSQLGSRGFMPRFKVKVPVVPLDPAVTVQFDSVSALVHESGEIMTSLLGNTHLNILKRSDSEVGYLAAVLQVLDSAYLAPLKKLETFHELDMVGYLGDREIAENLWPEGKPGTAITVVAQGDDGEPIERTYLGPGANAYDLDGDSPTSALQLANYLNRCLIDISGQLKDKLDQRERQQALVLLEERMVAKTDSLLQRIDSVTTDPESVRGRALASIKTNVGNRLDDYSKREENSDKPGHARELIDCIDRFDALAGALVDLPAKRLSVTEKYNDRVWNPFTATLMDDVVKKRIVNAYGNILLPHLLNRITSETDCRQAGELEAALQALHERVVQLREEDTAKLERKLKKQRDPKAILELFNLQAKHR